MRTYEDGSILIVDDERDQAQLYANQFSRRNWRSKAVFSGSEAISALHGEHFGVVLLDMKMPEMDGFETLTAILKAFPDQCVVFFTGFGDVSSAVRALKLGASSMLLKDGIRFEDLIDAVQVDYSRTQRELLLRSERDLAIATAAKMESASKLANGCAHTVKNRLVAVTTRLDLIEVATSLDGIPNLVVEARERLGSAFLAIKRLERIGQVRCGETSLLCLAEVAREAGQMAMQTHAQHKVPSMRISLGISPDLFVRAERWMLVEAIESLISNAVEALIETGGRITVNAEADKDFVELTISDTGLGFTEKMLNSAHEPFCTSKGDSHFGYGLTFAKAVMELFGGELKYGNLSDASGAFVRARLPLLGREDSVSGANGDE